MDTPLRLEDYFFPHVSTTADPNFSLSDNEEIPFPEIVVNVNETDAKNVFQLAVNISLEPKDDEHIIPYITNLVVIGIFSVAENWEDKIKLLKITGASMLYGAAREFLITITSRGPWDAYKLPTFSFLQAYSKSNPADDQEEDKKKF